MYEQLRREGVSELQQIGQRMIVLVLALVFAWGLVIGGTQPPAGYGAGPTPTPTPAQAEGEPGGHGGGT